MNFEFAKAFAVPNKPITDRWYGKLIIQIYGNMLPFEVGDLVEIQSPLYEGKHTIGYIYKGFSTSNGNYYNLYFEDLDFEGTTSGKIAIVTDELAAAPEKTAAPVPEKTLLTKISEPVRETAQVLYTADSQQVVDTVTDKVEDVAEIVVEKANSMPSRWFYFILFLAAVAVFIYFQNKK